MCSIGNDVEEESQEKFMVSKLSSKLYTELCNKCKVEKPCIILRGKDVYCKTCFLNGTLHKFKSFFGKYRFCDKNDRVIIAHDCGHRSTALLHFLHTGSISPLPNRIQFKPIVVYIERHFELPPDERRDILKKVEKDVKQFNFPLYFVCFTSYIVTNKLILTENSDAVYTHQDDKCKVASTLGTSNRTNEIEMLEIIRRKLLVNIARELHCKFVITTELGNDIASKILTNVSLGRGSHLPLDTGMCDMRNPLVQIIRPLRSFDTKELAFYNFFNNLEPITYNREEDNAFGSIQSLITKFVHTLQTNFPATITTVVKIGDKLTVDKDTLENDRCLLCEGPVETKSTSQLTSSESTEFSHWLSTKTPDYNLSPQDRYLDTVTTFEHSTDGGYCFSCKKILN